MTEQPKGNDITIGECSSIYIPKYCEYQFKLDESNYTFQCVKFEGHKGKHFIVGKDI